MEARIPSGMRDLSLNQVLVKNEMIRRLMEVYGRHHYREVQTPAIEYFQTYGTAFDALSEQEMYRFFDEQGNTLTLRLDMTVPIARMAAAGKFASDGALRLCYAAPVYKVRQSLQGKRSEVTDCGVELIADLPERNIEILGMVQECLEALGLKDAVVEIGDKRFFETAASAVFENRADIEALAKMIDSKSLVELEEFLDEKGLDEKTKAFFMALPTLYGTEDVLKTALDLANGNPVLEAIVNKLALLTQALKEAYPDMELRFDFGKLPHLNYYTGLIFEAYAPGAGTNILSGGQYDRLMESFGRPSQAIGFSLKVDDLLDAVSFEGLPLDENEKAPVPCVNHERLRIALTKGRLEDATLSLLEQSGYGTEKARNKGRALVLEDTIKDIDYVLVKSNDCLTYVEHGAADLGVVGLDTILEKDSDLYEMLDLHLGECHFIVAALPEADLFNKTGHIRIGSKYPKVAKDYFLKRGKDVEVIKIDGSVELSPLLGMVDGIVDIMETGSTLRANGLQVLDTICRISARVVVNKASYRLKRDQILEVLEDLRKGIANA